MPFQEDLDHSCRRWQAEEENARRLSGRTRLVATVLFGVVGAILIQSAGAIREGIDLAGPWLWAFWPGMICLLVGAGFSWTALGFDRIDRWKVIALRFRPNSESYVKPF